MTASAVLDDGRVARTASVSRWSPKELAEDSVSGWIHQVVADFNRLMRPPRYADEVQPTMEAVRSSLHLLAQVMSPDSIPPLLVPRFGGGIQMEWHVKGVDLEIYIDSDGAASAWCEHMSGREWAADGQDLSIATLRKELSLLTRHD